MADTRQPRFNARHRSAGIVRFGMWDEINHAMVCLVDPKLVAIDPRFQRDHDKRHSGGMALKRPHVVPYPVCNYSTTTNELDDRIVGILFLPVSPLWHDAEMS